MKNYGLIANSKIEKANLKNKALRLIQKGYSISEVVQKTKLSDTAIRIAANKIGLKYEDKFHQGFIITHNGYKMIRIPNHIDADSKGYVREHRIIAEKKLNRMLLKTEIVHHIDGNKLNNNPDNLEVMTLAKHTSHHHKGK
jgi:HNH endonuclease.